MAEITITDAVASTPVPAGHLDMAEHTVAVQRRVQAYLATAGRCLQDAPGKQPTAHELDVSNRVQAYLAAAGGHLAGGPDAGGDWRAPPRGASLSGSRWAMPGRRGALAAYSP